MVHGIQAFWSPILIQWCFRQTLQTFSTPFCVRPFSKNFGQWEASYLNFALVFVLFMAFRFLCTSIIIIPQRFCLSFFLLWAHDKVTCLQGLFFHQFIFVFNVVLQRYSFHVSSFPWPMKPISSTIPMSFPLFFIILFPSWFLWSYLFNSANVWRGLHVAYLLSSSPLLNFVTPMVAS